MCYHYHLIRMTCWCVISLLDRCEDKTDNKINYVEFLTKLKVDVQPGDLVGLSTQIMDSSGRAELRRMADQFNR